MEHIIPSGYFREELLREIMGVGTVARELNYFGVGSLVIANSKKAATSRRTPNMNPLRSRLHWFERLSEAAKIASIALEAFSEGENALPSARTSISLGLGNS